MLSCLHALPEVSCLSVPRPRAGTSYSRDSLAGFGGSLHSSMGSDGDVHRLSAGLSRDGGSRLSHFGQPSGAPSLSCGQQPSQDRQGRAEGRLSATHSHEVDAMRALAKAEQAGAAGGAAGKLPECFSFQRSSQQDMGGESVAF